MVKLGPLRYAARTTGLEDSALFALLELQLLVAAHKAAGPAFACARGLAAVNTLLRDRDFYATILAIVDIAFLHFTAFGHDCYLLPEDIAKRYAILSTYNQSMAACQGGADLDGKGRQKEGIDGVCHSV